MKYLLVERTIHFISHFILFDALEIFVFVVFVWNRTKREYEARVAPRLMRACRSVASYGTRQQFSTLGMTSINAATIASVMISKHPHNPILSDLTRCTVYSFEEDSPIT